MSGRRHESDAPVSSLLTALPCYFIVYLCGYRLGQVGGKEQMALLALCFH